MTAYKDLFRHPKHNGRKHLRVTKAPALINDFGTCLAGRPFRQTVRTAMPRRPMPHAR